jgi:hypothetical protein
MDGRTGGCCAHVRAGLMASWWRAEGMPPNMLLSRERPVLMNRASLSVCSSLARQIQVSWTTESELPVWVTVCLRCHRRLLAWGSDTGRGWSRVNRALGRRVGDSCRVCRAGGDVIIMCCKPAWPGGGLWRLESK